MSNFETFAPITEGYPGTAVARFVASTADTLALLTVAGYMNDYAKIVKANDLIDINYQDTSTYPLNPNESALFGTFQVFVNPSTGNTSLRAYAPVLGLTVLGASGVHSALYTNAGGSATTVISDTRIFPGMKVKADWKSSANAVTVQSVVSGNGTLTIVSSGDPGASVLSYIAVQPSALLVNSGVEASRYAYAGGAATFTFTDAAVKATDVINGNFSTSATAVTVDSITAGAGTVTVVCSANPGVSVFDYVSVLPSVALSAQGLYSAQAANAGAGATLTITDANILATSIVTADFQAQTTASQIQKVTATAGTLTILCSAAPGASTLSYISTAIAQ